MALSELQLPATDKDGRLRQRIRALEESLMNLRTTVATSSGGTPAPSGPTMIRGSVSGAGAILRGTGFSITRTSTGHYTINFSTAFPSTPVVLASTTSWGIEIAESGRTASSVSLDTFNTTTGAVQDIGFDFLAIQA